MSKQGQPHSTPTGRRAMTISDEAVEAAAKAICMGPSGISHEQLEIALEAAAPHIRAQALEEAADHLMRIGWNNACTAHLRARAVAERGGSNNG